MYVTDALKIALGLDRRYVDYFRPSVPEQEPEEIVAHVRKLLEDAQ